MSTDLHSQNFTQIVWTTVIGLNLYFAIFFYRVSKKYRAERLRKLQATANLKEHLQKLRTEYANSIISATAPPIATAGKTLRAAPAISLHTAPAPQSDCHAPRGAASRLANRCPMRKPHEPQILSELDTSSNPSIDSSRSDFSRLHQRPQDEVHTLYISDSFGRVVQELTFRESDYLDALQSVLSEQ